MWKPLRLVLMVGILGVGTDSDPAAPPATAEAEVTLFGSLLCNGACVAEPKAEDHLPVLYVIDGPQEVRAEVQRILDEHWPERGLDGPAAVKVMEQFTERLKYYLTPDSPALAQNQPTGKSHYCMPAEARAVSGVVSVRDGRRWIQARRIEPTQLAYPARMLAADEPRVKPDRPPVVLKIDEQLELSCVYIPAGQFLMGTPFYMWPYYVEEYPHLVTLSRPFYLSEIPITQAMYQAVMGENPSTVKDPQLPVQDPSFAQVERFCQLLSQRSGRSVRLPTDAEWEYAARVGTSNPGFPQKYQEQNSTGPEGKTPLPVKSRRPNAWGLYDMASCWWEISGDRGMYNVRKSETDPRYPPRRPETSKSQRSGRGIVKDNWSISTHEFITEKGYAGQKFRVVVEAEDASSRPGGE